MHNLSSNTHVTVRSNANEDLYPDNTCYNFTNQFCTTLNYRDKTKVALSEIHLPLNFRYNFESQDLINQIFILTDLVDDSIVGDSRLSILKVITVDKKLFPSNTQVLLFKNLFFYPITQNSINNITVRMTNVQGNILIENPKTITKDFDETFVVLQFK